MDVTQVERNSSKIQSCLKEVDNSLIVVKPIKVHIPEKYMSTELGVMSDTIKIVGIFGIISEDKYYAVSKACSLLETIPYNTNYVDINNEKYIEFLYDVNDVLIKNLNLIRLSTLVYRIYNEIIAKGKIPWYFSYSDLSFLFDTALLHGNANLTTDSALFEILASSMARQQDDRVKFFRHTPNLTLADNLNPTYIALKSVAYNATNTTAKLLGAYFNEGLNSALVNPSDNSESIEELLRN
jgi:hypothetical protein